jgi:hypothetical protein
MRMMGSYITIADYGFPHCNSVTITQSRRELVQRATVKLPNIKGTLSVEEAIKVGDAIKIELGYDGNLHEEFRGYVTQINPNRPFSIECEDEMWQLKQTVVNKSWKTIKLRELLEYLVPEADINCQDITLTDFRIVRSSKAKALQEIKDTYGLDAYYKNGQLYVGLAYLDGENQTLIYDFQKNCLEGRDLEFRKKEEVKIKIRAVAFTPDNKRIEVFYPDDDLEDYEERTLTFYNKSESELKEIAKERLDDFIYDGYRGTIVGFGIPRPRHGMIVDLRDNRYPERSGKVFIDAVKTTFSTKGFRRKIILGRRAAA